MTLPMVNITPLGRLTLDDLWREAESLGFVRGPMRTKNCVPPSPTQPVMTMLRQNAPARRKT